MKKFLITLLSACLFTITGAAKNLKDYKEYLDYTIEGAGTGQQGTYLVKITVNTKDKNLPDDVLRMCAVHGVLFKGFRSESNRQRQKPIAGSALAESKNADFYNIFFNKDKAYNHYASIQSGTRTVVKMGKIYQISVNLIIEKEQLIRDLQELGIIKSLNSAF